MNIFEYLALLPTRRKKYEQTDKDFGEIKKDTHKHTERIMIE